MKIEHIDRAARLDSVRANLKRELEVIARGELKVDTGLCRRKADEVVRAAVKAEIERELRETEAELRSLGIEVPIVVMVDGAKVHDPRFCGAPSFVCGGIVGAGTARRPII